MTSIERIEASAATHAATGITHYVFDSAAGWKAFGGNDAEIVSQVVSKEARNKGVLRVHSHDKHVEITYSIERHENHFVIDTVVNDTPSKVTFSQDGELISKGLKETVDPVFNEIFRSIDSDWKEMVTNRRQSIKTPIAEADGSDVNYCLGLYDAIQGARKAYEFWAEAILEYQFVNCGVEYR